MIQKEIVPLFEVSWEVCNKVGGINTVIRSKVQQIKKHYKDNYYFIGPYFPENALKEFQVLVPPENLQKIFEKLSREGIICHYGRWLIPEEPRTILVDYKNYAVRDNQIKAALWESYRIDSLGTLYHDFDEPIIWGDAVGRLLEELYRVYDHKMIAQFHEWLAAGALLYLKRNKVPIATVFTTHATVLGRTLAGNNVELYDIISEIDPEKEAYSRGVASKHQVERVAAQVSDVFTTVSEITGIEAEHFLKRKPDVLLYNGLDMSMYPTLEETSIKHKLYKAKMKSFLQYFFFPYYSFNLDKTLIFFLSGRYEFHNKGVDIFIEALARLNDKLKKEKNGRTIVVFFWVPRDSIRIKPDLVRSRANYMDIQESIEDNLKEVEGRMIKSFITKNSFNEKDLYSKDFLFKMRKKVYRFLQKGNPPLSTHDLPNEEDDAIISACKARGLLNREEDPVKVVFYPTYLSGADNLLDLDYNESIMSTHLGVFPSYYEPWGYTPLETAALAVASVSTDFAGFGRYLPKQTQEYDPGIYIVEMYGKKWEQRVENLYRVLHKYAKYPVEERVRNKVEARRLASLADWDKLIENYIEAHAMALERTYSLVKEPAQQKKSRGKTPGRKKGGKSKK